MSDDAFEMPCDQSETNGHRFHLENSHLSDKAHVIPIVALEIGFDWLCFLAALKHKYSHITLSHRHLRSFYPFENWLCFFK